MSSQPDFNCRAINRELPSIQRLKSKMRLSSVLMERLTNVQSDIAEDVEKIAKTIPPGLLLAGEGPLEKTHGASDLQVWEDSNGKLTFSFDFQKTFPLTPRLSKALIFLASEAGNDHSGDGILGFRPRSEFLAHLQKTAKPGKLIRPAYVNNVSSLLRAAIIKHTGRILITTHDEWGVRLLLKRGGLHGLEATSASKWL
jgi:hypothetical protein